MTEEERQFAAEHHNLVYAFLRREDWDPDEYYDVAAWGFLRAVMRYFKTPQLRKYSFATIAWKAMRRSLSAFHREETLRLEGEKRYAETEQRAASDPFDELEARLLLHDLVSSFDGGQYELASMRLQGYSVAEIARAHGMPSRRVSGMLGAMYRVYLKLYKE